MSTQEPKVTIEWLLQMIRRADNILTASDHLTSYTGDSHKRMLDASRVLTVALLHAGEPIYGPDGAPPGFHPLGSSFACPQQAPRQEKPPAEKPPVKQPPASAESAGRGRVFYFWCVPE